MEETSVEKIKKNIVYIKSHLLDASAQSIADHLLADEILNFDQWDGIRSKGTVQAKCDALVNDIIRGPRRGYDAFVKALRATANDHIADLLESTETESIETDSTEGNLVIRIFLLMY